MSVFLFVWFADLSLNIETLFTRILIYTRDGVGFANKKFLIHPFSRLPDAYSSSMSDRNKLLKF